MTCLTGCTRSRRRSTGCARSAGGRAPSTSTSSAVAGERQRRPGAHAAAPPGARASLRARPVARRRPGRRASRPRSGRGPARRRRRLGHPRANGTPLVSPGRNREADPAPDAAAHRRARGGGDLGGAAPHLQQAAAAHLDRRPGAADRGGRGGLDRPRPARPHRGRPRAARPPRRCSSPGWWSSPRPARRSPRCSPGSPSASSSTCRACWTRHPAQRHGHRRACRSAPASLLLAAALFLEYCCRVPKNPDKDDDSDPHRPAIPFPPLAPPSRAGR